MLRRISLRRRFTVAFAVAVLSALMLFSGAILTVLVLDARAEVAAQRASGEDVDEDPYDVIKRVLGAMAVLVPLAVAGAAALGYGLARAALAPMREASERARNARASDLDLVLPVRGSGDEWDELAGTLNQLHAEARAGLERVRRFTSDAAHELRTPLAAMLGEAEVALRRERTAAELRQSLEGLRAETVRMIDIVNGLLLLARADMGRLAIAASEVPLDEIARAAVERARRQAERGSRPARFSLSGSAPAVRADVALLSRAVDNLLDNALRYGGARVRLTLSADGGRAVLEVADDGPGVPPELAGAIFDRFVRADPARSGEGVGLGLAIARAVVAAHGGTLELRPGPGAVFRLELPAEPAA